MNTYKDAYAVQVINKRKAGKPPRYLRGFRTRAEAEDKMNHLSSEETYMFKVVYIRECITHGLPYPNPQSTITEIPEYFSLE